MPRENKQRGRRGDKKRKREDDQIDDAAKRHKSEELTTAQNEVDIRVSAEAGDDFISFGVRPDVTEVPFLGLLTQEDQDYYASVDKKLVLNDFESDEDRAEFIEAVYRESNGKELKVASSQSSSRYMEKVIMLSNPEQLKRLFNEFLGNFTHLVQHRFASHCCEALFLHAAPAVGKDSDADVTMESLFLKVVGELKPNLGYLLTERFASHVVRVLMIVLSGESLDSSSTSTVLASRKKEKIEAPSATVQTAHTEQRTVPKLFLAALKDLIAAATSTLEPAYLRALATHPTGNPVLQLLLRLELTRLGRAKDEHSVLRKLLPDEDLEYGSDSAKFVQGIIYDATGSRLVETIVQYVPGKLFKKLYKNVLREKMGLLAKNDTASYVAIKIIERLSKDDLEAAMDQILPELPALAARCRVNVIRALVERCTIRGADMKSLLTSLKLAYGDEVASRLLRILKLDAALDQDQGQKVGKEKKLLNDRKAHAVDLHGSLLAQSILQAPVICDFVYESLLAMPPGLLLLLAKDATASRVIQLAITCETSSMGFRRTLIPSFYGHISELAIDPAGSHLADALWNGTAGSHFMKERIAKELQEHETDLRESKYGRTVWRNWSMDLYQRRSYDWQAQAKGITAESALNESAPKKSAIQLARARHAEQKARVLKQKGRPSTVSANA